MAAPGPCVHKPGEGSLEVSQPCPFERKTDRLEMKHETGPES